MPLDPQIHNFLHRFNSRKGNEPILSLPPAEARKAMSTLFGSVPGNGRSVGIEKVDNIRIPAPGGPLGIRVYRPKSEGPLPGLIFFHGGGWVLGSLSLSDYLCRMLCANTPCLVVSADYRLAPEHKFPAALEDGYAALQWLSDCAGEFGADKNRIAVGGESAGGNLAAALCILARDKGGPSIAYQLLITPATDLSSETDSYRQFAEGYFLTGNTMETCKRYYLNDAKDAVNPLVSPLLIDDPSGLPPGLVVTAEFDPLRDEGEAYARKLGEAGVKMELKRYAGTIHGFATFAGFDIGRRALLDMASALRQIAAADDQPMSP